MPTDRNASNAEASSMSWMRGAINADPDEASAVDLGWWVTGGMSLLAWTGLALLLTTA